MTARFPFAVFLALALWAMVVAAARAEVTVATNWPSGGTVSGDIMGAGGSGAGFTSESQTAAVSMGRVNMHIRSLTYLRCINYTDKVAAVAIMDEGVVKVAEFLLPAHGGIRLMSPVSAELAGTFATIQKPRGVHCRAKWGHKP